MKITKTITGGYGLVKFSEEEKFLKIINNHPDKFRLIEMKKVYEKYTDSTYNIAKLISPYFEKTEGLIMVYWIIYSSLEVIKSPFLGVGEDIIKKYNKLFLINVK